MVLAAAEIILMISMVLLVVAFFSLYERQVLSYSQSRKGPNKVALGGLAQPLADAMKLVSKNTQEPIHFGSFSFNASPLMFLFLVLLVWPSAPIVFMPPHWGFSGLWVVLVLSMSVYGTLVVGWVSVSKYAILGSMRSVAQSISYEIVLTTSLFSLFLFMGSLSISGFRPMQSPVWFIFTVFPLFIIVTLCLLAEGGRSPFDLAEGESEIVSGYSVEYGGVQYTCLFLSENISLVFSACLINSLFMGELASLKMTAILTGLVAVRATLPRMRYDAVMECCWLMILPLALLFMFLITVMV
uniref:NADH-ubiquinone oxidoreductase chain 1 n=1 Tax=Pedicinus obtusus TaxID=592408 RepID=A0A7T0FYF1_9NEOP|nr:NADH dehydrogenase subunit 1 [Pedicinus obtusus]